MLSSHENPCVTSPAISTEMASTKESSTSQQECLQHALDTPQQRSRAYQLEMLEASLNQNVIVAMNTGSGKTRIAVLRISAELDKGNPGKQIWFLTPTVALCKQQCVYISSCLPAVPMRALIGDDGVDRWSNQNVWDAALKDMSVIVATYAVLADALSNGFVTMKQLALLVFDEAHHCTAKHPANQIMKLFYHPYKCEYGADAVPHILGLTASPIIRSKPAALRVIEANLDSTVRSPQLHYQDLLRFVNPPSTREVIYQELPEPPKSSAMEFLFSIGITGDNAANQNITKLSGQQVWSYWTDLYRKGKHLQKELGSWATDCYLASSIDKMDRSPKSDGDITLGLSMQEHAYLAELAATMDKANVSRQHLEPEGLPDVSLKAECLIKILVAEYSKNFLGIVFVDQRVVAVALNDLLSNHPETRNLFKCGVFMGISTSGDTRHLGNLVRQKEQDQTLRDFSKGKKNLIIATSALEEGIDISACNKVICFDKPPNLKSFVQRRGRARKIDSTFIIMFPRGDKTVGTTDWQKLEREMIDEYRRKREAAEDMQYSEEGGEEHNRILKVESTGALLTLDGATAKISHFCNKLTSHPYTDSRPIFIIERNQLTNLKSARIILPNCVDPSLRQARSSQEWRKGNTAKKDAALEAYIALYNAGLVNDNLLPALPGHAPDIIDEIAKSPSVVDVAQQYDPWVSVAEAWPTVDQFHTSRVSLRHLDQKVLDVNLILPLKLYVKSRFSLYVDEEITFQASIDEIPEDNLAYRAEIPLMKAATDLILRSIHRSFMIPDQNDFIALFVPTGPPLQLEHWLMAHSGSQRCTSVALEDIKASKFGLIRAEDFWSDPFMEERQQEFVTSSEHCNEASPPRYPDADATIQARPISKRRDFLHEFRKEGATADQSNTHRNRKVENKELSLKGCTVDHLPMVYSKFALFVPSIHRRLEVNFVAGELSKSMLPFVRFQNMDLVVNAISIASAQESSDYRDLAILGDTILKFLTTVELFATHSKWPEEYLSTKRQITVCNKRLAEAALAKGLDKFLVTESFTGRDWRPSYVSDFDSHRVNGTRSMSIKELADAVEALIGAAFLDGGYTEAASCIRYFLPEVRDSSLESLLDSYKVTRLRNIPYAQHYSQLEDMIGYSFKDKSLLIEALTHGSWYGDHHSSSYRRLSFLGDAILDMVIVEYMSQKITYRRRSRVHRSKIALVNAHFLAFLCLEFSVTITLSDVQKDTTGNPTKVQRQKTIHIWEFMRYGAPGLDEGRNATLQRYMEIGNHIRLSLSRGTTYPWQYLRELDADNFFSDVIQSLFGAVYIDSRGDLPRCTLLAKRIGFIEYLQRVLEDEVDLFVPKGPEDI